ncbi:MAG: ubiquinone/menaquinone biosynthesis methyltransferase, partial [Alphaproteobacteria bacterium]|nr:ubiquinone/menaquinone biosynthesis methyltransferase [Alphaproteobacteria bacterium]
MPRAARNPEATQFGFAHVGDAGEKTQRVGHVFQRVAPRYDVMNDVMSGGWHRVWKNIFVDVVAPRAGENVLDVAGGTGDIAKRLLKKTGGAINLTLADLSPEMLSVGKRRMADAGYWNKVTWVQADAAALPFDDACFDVITIAFGLRNVTRIDDALAEFYRCLRTGGRFFCMEFSPQVAAPLA